MHICAHTPIYSKLLAVACYLYHMQYFSADCRFNSRWSAWTVRAPSRNVRMPGSDRRGTVQWSLYHHSQLGWPHAADQQKSGCTFTTCPDGPHAPSCIHRSHQCSTKWVPTAFKFCNSNKILVLINPLDVPHLVTFIMATCLQVSAMFPVWPDWNHMSVTKWNCVHIFCHTHTSSRSNSKLNFYKS